MKENYYELIEKDTPNTYQHIHTPIKQLKAKFHYIEGFD